MSSSDCSHRPIRVRSVIGVPSRIDARRAGTADLDVPVYVVDKWVLSDVVGFRVTRGVMAAADRPAPRSMCRAACRGRRSPCSSRSTTSRTSARSSATPRPSASTPSLLDPQCADPLYRRSVRVSMGHVLRVPFAVCPGPWPAVAWRVLRERGSRCSRMTPACQMPPPCATIAAPPRWAVLLGAEGPGTHRGTRWPRLIERVRIPMATGR